MARTLGEVVADVPAERRAKIAAARRAKIAAARRAKIAAAHGHKLIAEEQKRLAVEKWLRLERVKRAMELDRNLIAIAAVITALPIVAALAWMVTALALAVGGR
jgi:hypothetical protein